MCEATGRACDASRKLRSALPARVRKRMAECCLTLEEVGEYERLFGTDLFGEEPE